VLYTRRELGKLALAVPAAGLAPAWVTGQVRPNSLIDGVQIGTITYSYRSMPDQSAEATLRYVVESGISAVELMGGPVESFAGAPAGGRGGGRGGRGPGDGRGPLGEATASTEAVRGGSGAQSAAPNPQQLPEGAKKGSWNGQPCVIPEERGQRGGGGQGRGRGEMTPEQQAAQQEQAAKLRSWRTSVSMEAFKKLRKMYNDAGVTIYAWKQLNPNMSDDEFEYVFNVAEALGCTHTTLELPTNPDQLRRIGDFAMKKKIYAAYHTHGQGSMTAFDQAFALSNGNMSNVDFGHWVAAGNVGGTPMQFLEKYHDRIASFHLKDRTKPEHCALNLPWGTAETPITEILRLVKQNRWRIPATIELEYQIPEGSDAVKEVRKCLEYCKNSLTAKT
jgi:sugar phosphate isomerase/epimerase